MFTNLSNIRFAGEPYLAAPVPALPPLKMKSTGKLSRKNSSPQHKKSGTATSNLAVAAKSKSKVKASVSKTPSKDVPKKEKKKKKKSEPPAIKVPGDAVVVAIDSLADNNNGVVDMNANTIEPFTEQISKDIALAVAMIVAEHEMLKAKYPDKYDVDEEDGEASKGKTVSFKKPKASASQTSLGKSDKSGNEGNQVQDTQAAKKDETVTPAPQTESGQTKNSKMQTSETTGQVKPSTSIPTDVNPTAILPPAVTTKRKSKESKSQGPPKKESKTRLSSKSESKSAGPTKSGSRSRLVVKNDSSLTFVVPSRTTTAMPPTTASAASLSTIESGQMVSCPPVPSIGAKMGGQMEVLKYLGRIQHYMNRLGYHRNGEPGIRINTRLSTKMQMVTAREIIQSSLPIKCLHAVVLAVYFTNCIESVERFPIYFRSHVGSKEYKHIVLGIYVQGHFGALGISRDGGLQDKPLSYSKLSDLIFEFAKCYGQSGHILNEVKFGSIITHNQHSLERMFNKNYVVPIVGCLHSDIERNVEKFAKQLRSKMGMACLKSLRVDSALQQPRFSRSKSSLNVTVVSDRSSTSLRTRALSMGPLFSSSRGSLNKNDDATRQSNKVTVTQSKPTHPKPSKK